jgi:hypothetical protein
MIDSSSDSDDLVKNQVDSDDDVMAHHTADENFGRGQPPITDALKFKNKFSDFDHDTAATMLEHKTHDHKARNPMHFMHRVHQTEEDQENPELIEDDIRINNFFKLNDDKANLMQALHENSAAKHNNKNKVYSKNFFKYVKFGSNN